MSRSRWGDTSSERSHGRQSGRGMVGSWRHHERQEQPPQGLPLSPLLLLLPSLQNESPPPLRPHCPKKSEHHRADCTRYDVDRKSTRLNSSHSSISYAVFCLKKIN